MNNIEVSFILVNYNTYCLTKQCIDSIHKQIHSCSYEIILVDNSSTDGSKDYFEKDASIHYIYNTENLGFGKANNIGIKEASGKYIFLLNTDTILLNDVLSFFLNYEHTHGDNLVLGAYLLDGDQNPTASYGKFPTCSSELKTALNVYLSRLPWSTSNYYTIPSQKEVSISVDYIIGADLFIPKIALTDCGMFDDQFFMYYEETDLQKRFEKKNYSRIVIPGPSILHLCQGSQKNYKTKKNIKKSILASTSMLKYIRKYNSSPVFYTFKLLYFVLRLVPVLFLNISIKEKYEYLSIFIKTRN